MAQIPDDWIERFGKNAHNLIPDGMLAFLPAMYATEGVPTADKIVWVKYFDPSSNWTWYLVEYDPKEKIAFGYVQGYEREWGYFSLSELATVRNRLGLGIERDIYFRPQRFGDLKLE